MPRLPALPFRRLLRQNATDAEHVLWTRLRDRRLGGKFRRQHTMGAYTLDFYCPAARVAIELDGGQHYEGGAAHASDRVRDAWLAARGIRVLRFSDRDALLETGAVEEAIWNAIDERRAASRGRSAPAAPSPRPSPPSSAGGRGR